jgi:hypothetical protein
MATRTNQYIDLVSREPVDKMYNLEIELVQRHVKVDHEHVERIVVIWDAHIKVLFCDCRTSGHL